MIRQQKFYQRLSSLYVVSGSIIITGEFNFDVDDPGNTYANQFINLLESCSLKQHVNEVTHANGHTFDLAITKCDDHLIKDIMVTGPAISDHHAVYINLCMKEPQFVFENGKLS